MTPRSIRRAAERKARKEQARRERNRLAQAAENEPLSPDFLAALHPASAPLLPPKPAEMPVKSVSTARLAANRRNALRSTGPTTDPGRATAALNALKTGLTGRTVLLSSDDARLYEKHVLSYIEDLRPLTPRECELVQSLADTAWRLKRIPVLEMTFYARGRTEFAEMFAGHDPALRPNLLDLHTYLTYEKQLRNLHIQEARLTRRYEREMRELRTLQAEREEREASARDGFEFSSAPPDPQPAATPNPDLALTPTPPDLQTPPEAALKAA